MNAELHEPEGQLSSISRAKTLWEISEFWDTHNLTDYHDQTEDVTDQFEVSLPSKPLPVAVDPELLEEARATIAAEGSPSRHWSTWPFARLSTVEPRSSTHLRPYR